jgi:glycosyltransferase involved in cell wall biosynthesis
MKILVVTQYFWPENFRINDLCHGLVERGHEVTVYTGLPNYPDGEFFEGYSFTGPYQQTLGKIKIVRSPLLPRGKNKSLKLALNYFSYFFLSSLLAPFLVRGKFDKIFVYEPSPITVAIPGLVLKYIKRIPMILWVTDLWPESLEATGVVKNKYILWLVGVIVKLIYKFTDRILITSKGFHSRISAMGVSENKIEYWPQWAEALFQSTSTPSDYTDANIPDSGFKLMFAGNIGSSQDFETIVKAAEQLKGNKNIHILVLGDGMMKKWAESEVERLGLSETFHFLGRKPVELMPYYYSKADAMLMSLTDNELFTITVPSKLQSYLASGKPVLVSMNGEGADIVNEWKAGLTCPATQPRQLADTILKMSQKSPHELKQYGDNALECYLSEFEREKLLTQLEDEFKLLERK